MPPSEMTTGVVLCGKNIHETTVAGFAFELNGACDTGKKSVIGTHADILTGVELGTALTDNDHTRFNFLRAKYFDSQPLAGRIAAVCGRSLRFCMCHCMPPETVRCAKQ